MTLTMPQKLKIALLLMCIVALGALAFSWFTSKENEACGPDWGTLSVKVTDNYSLSLRGANVSLYLQEDLVRSGLTDTKGELSFGHLSYESYNLTVTKAGCAFRWRYLPFREPKQMSFTLDYLNFTLRLQVKNAKSGLEVADASLLLYRFNYYNDYQEGSGTTNASGGALFPELEYDEYALVVWKNGFYNQSLLLRMEAEVTVSIQLMPQLGPPEPPVLAPIAPMHSTTGLVLLNWSLGNDVAIYYLFRDTTPISAGSGLVPIAVVWTTTYQDSLGVNGTYYYAVIARNSQGNSSLSNCASVVVALPASPYPSYQSILNFFGIAFIIAFIGAYFLLQRRGRPAKGKYGTFTSWAEQRVRIHDDAGQLQEPSKPNIYTQPDVFEGITYAVLVIFFLAVFKNITLLNSSVEAERIIATQYLAIASLGTAGLVMRAIYDHIPIRNKEGHILGVGITTTVHETRNASSLLQSAFYFAIAFGAQGLMSFVIMAFPLSAFSAPQINMMIMGVIGAVGEEIFFSYFATGLLFRQIRWLALPLVSIVFVAYHFMVYQTLSALIFVGIMRLVYSTVYILSRRLSSVMLAHVLNNLLVGLRI